MTEQKYEHFTSGIFPKRKSINQISPCVRYNLLCYLWHNVLDRVESWCEVLEWSLGLMSWFGIIELYINEIFYEELFQCSTDLMDLHNNSLWPVFVASNNIYHESVSYGQYWICNSFCKQYFIIRSKCQVCSPLDNGYIYKKKSVFVNNCTCHMTLLYHT